MGRKLSWLSPFYHLHRINYHAIKGEYKQVIKHGAAYGLSFAIYIVPFTLLLKDPYTIMKSTGLTFLSGAGNGVAVSFLESARVRIGKNTTQIRKNLRTAKGA